MIPLISLESVSLIKNLQVMTLQKISNQLELKDKRVIIEDLQNEIKHFRMIKIEIQEIKENYINIT